MIKDSSSVSAGAIRNYGLGLTGDIPLPSVNRNTNLTNSKKNFSGSHFKSHL